MSKKLPRELLQRQMSRREFLGFTVVAGASIIGVTRILSELSSRAAGLPVAIEPEAGTLAGGATAVTNAAASGGKVLKFGAAAGDTRPTGPGYVRYEDLYVAGDSVSAALARLTVPAVITFPEGVFEGRDFATGYFACIDIPKICKGLWGSGKGTLGGTSGTILTIAPNSSTKLGIPGAPSQTQGGTTQCTVLRQLSGTQGFILKNLQVRGTAQGHNFQGTEISNNTGKVVIEDVLFTGWEGDNGSPPGETFGISVYNAGGGSEFTRCEADGRRTVGGPIFGAVGFTCGRQYGSVWNDVWAHHCRAAGVVFYRSFHVRTYNVRTGSATDPGPDLVGGHWNHENSGDIVHTNPVELNTKTNTGVNMTFSNGNFAGTLQGHSVNAADGSLTIINPTFSPLYTNGRFYIQSWTSGIDGGSPDTMVTPPVLLKADGITHIPYTWVHGTHQIIT